MKTLLTLRSMGRSVYRWHVPQLRIRPHIAHPIMNPRAFAIGAAAMLTSLAPHQASLAADVDVTVRPPSRRRCPNQQDSK